MAIRCNRGLLPRPAKDLSWQLLWRVVRLRMPLSSRVSRWGHYVCLLHVDQHDALTETIELTSNHVSLPIKFKRVTKQRKINQQGIP